MPRKPIDPQIEERLVKFVVRKATLNGGSIPMTTEQIIRESKVGRPPKSNKLDVSTTHAGKVLRDAANKGAFSIINGKPNTYVIKQQEVKSTAVATSIDKSVLIKDAANALADAAIKLSRLVE